MQLYLSRLVVTAVVTVALSGCGKATQKPAPAANTSRSVVPKPTPDALFRAVDSGNTENLREMLAAGGDPNTTAPSTHAYMKCAPLLKRAVLLGGRASMIELLLKAGAKTELRDSDGETALHEAAKRGEVKIATLLLNAGADPNIQDKDGRAPLDFALKTSRSSTAESTNGGVAAVLLEKGAKLEPTTNRLCQAVVGGNCWLAQKLIEAGGNPNATEPLSERYSKGDTLLRMAVQRKNAEMVRTLLKSGADPDGKNAEGFSALHAAADEGSVGVARILLDAGADPNVRNNKGFAPLHYAVHEKVSVTMTLTPAQSGAMSSSIDIKSQSPSAKTTQQSVLELLLDTGADINAKTESGTTPLMEAGSASIVQLLVKRGADVNATNERGETALHTAMSGAGLISGDPLAHIQALVDCGADVNAVNKSGETPLDSAFFFVRGPGMEEHRYNIRNAPHFRYMRSKGAKLGSEVSSK